MNIEDLKKLKQWINWKYNGNRKKVPISSKNGKTGVNNKYKDTWATYEQVKANTKANGIGIILTNGLCGIDIDHKDINNPIVQDIFKLMDTYTEYSPSGNGFHLLFTVDMDRLPSELLSKYYQKNSHNKIECYISGITHRFFTFTENVVIDKPINERPKQLQIFLDKYMVRNNTVSQNTDNENLEESCQNVIDMIVNSEQAEKFNRLYFQGDTTLYNKDESSADMALCAILAFYCGEDFELIDKLFCGSKLYREKWDRLDYKYNTITKAIEFCNGKFYKQGINIRLVNQLKKLVPEKAFFHNDIGLSELFANIYSTKLRYNANAKEWYYYNGKVWVKDSSSMIAKQKMKELSKALLSYAISITDDISSKESYIKFIQNLGKFSNRENVLKDSQSKMYIYQNDFDKNSNLFNCQNGTLNLTTYEFMPHNPNDLLSKISNVVYNPQSKSVRFEKFMKEIMQGSKNKINYLQKALGYSLTTDTSQECCFLLYGKTSRNGKGTLTDTILYMLGDYATTAMPETLAQKKNKDSSRPSSDIAKLNGCRFVNISEPSQHMIIDSALLKTLTGRDKITARFLKQNDFEFYPQFKAFINTNYLPIIDDPTVFTSERINVITFDQQFKGKNQDKHLKDKLKNQDELSGIFNWCLEGLKKYNKEGLAQPQEIEQATLNYEKSNDKFTIFFQQKLLQSKGNVTFADTYTKYCEWCKKQKIVPISKSIIMERLRKEKLLVPRATVKGKTKTNVIVGYELKEPITQ